MKNLKNIFDFLKDEYGIFLKILFVVYIFTMIYAVKGLPIQIFTAKSQEIPESVLSEDIKQIIREDSIYIPKLGVYAPLSIVESTNPDSFIDPLSKGVTHFPSALPGEIGDSIILGHSSPPGWIDRKYDSVFSKINTLEKGDIVLVTYNNKEFKYLVQGSQIVNAGQETPGSLNNKANLQLISCWPPGIDNKRIVVYSELI